MTAGRHAAIAAVLAAAGIVFGTIFLVRPADRQTWATYEEVAELTPLIATAPVHHARLHDLGYALDELSAHVRNVCRSVPATRDVADVIEALRPALDGRAVRHHAIRPGSPRASRDARIVPLTIEMEGPFDSIFECLRRAETMERPVRVTSVAMNVLDEETRDRPPILAASIGLEVVFDSSGQGEGLP